MLFVATIVIRHLSGLKFIRHKCIPRNNIKRENNNTFMDYDLPWILDKEINSLETFTAF